jgi:flagellar biosynthesis GTPase FlhF
MINQLVRADPGLAGRLVQLGDELRAAAAALDGAKIRELSQERRRLVDSLIRQALQHAGEEAPSAALREDLTATFGAAVADPQVAQELAAGTLLRPVHRADFSPGLPGLTLVPPPAKAPTAQPAKAADRPEAADRPKAAGRVRAKDEARAAEEAKAARDAKAAEEARAAARARAAEERRRAIADAEQVAAEASRAADQAAQDERDEQDQVWGLEDQLDEARRRLSATRRRVRETQNAQQKARRALSRLKDPER